MMNKTYPEINGMNRKDLTEAIKLGHMNWDSLTAKGKRDLAPRLAAMEDRMRRLDAVEDVRRRGLAAVVMDMLR